LYSLEHCQRTVQSFSSTSRCNTLGRRNQRRGHGAVLSGLAISAPPPGGHGRTHVCVSLIASGDVSTNSFRYSKPSDVVNVVVAGDVMSPWLNCRRGVAPSCMRSAACVIFKARLYSSETCNRCPRRIAPHLGVQSTQAASGAPTSPTDKAGRGHLSAHSDKWPHPVNRNTRTFVAINI